MKPWPTNLRTLLFVVVLITLLLSAACEDEKSAAAGGFPSPKEGILDLRGFAFDETTPIPLEGEWDFYWNRFMTFEELDAEKADLSVRVPSLWKDYKLEKETLSGMGFATYRLHIVTDLPEGAQMGFRIFPLASAYEMYINDEKVASCGIPAKKEKGEQACFLPQVVTFSTPSREFDVIFHVSNHLVASGGAWYRIYFGNADSIRADYARSIQSESILFGACGIIFLFCLAVYCVCGRQKTNLILAFLCLFLTISLDAFGDFFLPRWFPWIPVKWLIFLWYISLAWTFHLLTMYLDQVYHTKASMILRRGFTIYLLPAQLFFLLAPVSFYTGFTPIYIGIAMTVSAATLYLILRNLRLRDPETWVNLACGIVLTGSFLHDLLYWNNLWGVGKGEILYQGIFLIIVLQMILQIRRVKFYYDGQSAAELAFLQAQIRPHFIFNTLNTVVAVSREDTDKARELLMEFSQYLRRSFDLTGRDQFVPLKHEIELAKAYATIEKARFGERLEVVFSPAPREWEMVPTLILQPLVENAIIHGILPKEEGGRVEVFIEEKEKSIFFQVCDNGMGMPEEAQARRKGTFEKGVGLENVDARLRKLYGKGLVIENGKDGGTKVSWEIPQKKGGAAKCCRRFLLMMKKRA